MTAAVEYAPLDQATYKHAAVLHKCLHSAHPVMWNGKVEYLQVITSRLAGGRVETEAYLTGNPQCIDIKEISLYEASNA